MPQKSKLFLHACMTENLAAYEKETQDTPQERQFLAHFNHSVPWSRGQMDCVQMDINPNSNPNRTHSHVAGAMRRQTDCRVPPYFVLIVMLGRKGHGVTGRIYPVQSRSVHSKFPSRPVSSFFFFLP